MINEELVGYIKQSKQAGLSNEEISKTLKENGWLESDIYAAFNSLGIKSANQEKQKTFSIFKKVVIIFGSIILGLVVLFFTIPKILNAFFSGPDAILNDSDLQIQPPIISIPDSENAFYDFEKIGEEIYLPTDDTGQNKIVDILSNKGWDDAFVADILQKNLKIFPELDSLAQKKYQDPAFANASNITYMMTVSVSNYTSLRNIGKILSLDTKYLVKHGRSKDAINESIRLLKIAGQIQSSRGGLVLYLIGTGMKKVALQNINDVLASGVKLQTAEKYFIKGGLEQSKNHSDDLKEVFRIEYRKSSSALDDVAKSAKNEITKLAPYLIVSGINFYYFKLNETKNLFADFYRSNVADVDKVCGSEITEPKHFFFDNNWVAAVKVYFTKNSIGKITYDLLTIQYKVVFEKKCEVDQMFDSVLSSI